MIAQWCMYIGNFGVYFTDNRYYRYGHISTDTNTDKYIGAPLLYSTVGEEVVPVRGAN